MHEGVGVSVCVCVCVCVCVTEAEIGGLQGLLEGQERTQEPSTDPTMSYRVAQIQIKLIQVRERMESL